MTAYKLFDMTIGESARFELSKTQIEAMFQDQKKASQYMAMIQKRAIDSPVLSEKDMFANSKGLIAMTKDLKQLDKAWNIVERMSAMDPVQGIEGATFALRELMSGDAISMVERFEMPRSVMNSIKKLPIKEQLIAMDKLLNKMGFGNQFIEKMSAEAIPQWEKALEKVRAALRKMGEDGLRKIEPLLVRFNDLLDSPQMRKFTEYGGDLIAGTFEAIIQAGKAAASYFESHFVNNPAFQNLPDIKSRVVFIISDLLSSFNQWLELGGNDQIRSLTESLAGTLIRELEYIVPKVTPDLMRIGGKFATTVLQGFNDGLKGTILEKLALNAGPGKAGKVLLEMFGFTPTYEGVKPYVIKTQYFHDKTPGELILGDSVPQYSPSQSALGSVKYASPIKSRLSREEMATVSTGAGSSTRPAASSTTINVNMHGLTIREEADVERIAYRLATELSRLQ